MTQPSHDIVPASEIRRPSSRQGHGRRRPEFDFFEDCVVPSATMLAPDAFGYTGFYARLRRETQITIESGLTTASGGTLSGRRFSRSRNTR